jgi:hypothetical protein
MQNILIDETAICADGQGYVFFLIFVLGMDVFSDLSDLYESKQRLSTVEIDETIMSEMWKKIIDCSFRR